VGDRVWRYEWLFDVSELAAGVFEEEAAVDAIEERQEIDEHQDENRDEGSQVRWTISRLNGARKGDMSRAPQDVP
jgi:hypothetical protein